MTFIPLWLTTHRYHARMSVLEFENGLPTGSFSGVQVLLVEDDRIHREFISQILGRLGCVVSVAVDGEDALRRIHDFTFDLILMDIDMPRMNGIEAGRRLREMKNNHELPDIPIIAISALTDPAVKKACLDVGMLDFIAKSMWRPMWEANIVEKLTQWLPCGETGQPGHGPLHAP